MRSSPASSTTAPPTSRAAKPSARLPARQQKSETDPSPTLTRQFDSLCPSYLVVCAVCAKCESSVQLVCRAVSGCDARAVGAGVVRSWLLTHSKLRNLTPPITTSHPGLRTPRRSIRGWAHARAQGMRTRCTCTAERCTRRWRPSARGTPAGVVAVGQPRVDVARPRCRPREGVARERAPHADALDGCGVGCAGRAENFGGGGGARGRGEAEIAHRTQQRSQATRRRAASCASSFRAFRAC